MSQISNEDAFKTDNLIRLLQLPIFVLMVVALITLIFQHEVYSDDIETLPEFMGWPTSVAIVALVWAATSPWQAIKKYGLTGPLLAGFILRALALLLLLFINYVYYFKLG